MKLNNKQVHEYLSCWMNNYGSRKDPSEIVGEAFGCDAALVQWEFKEDRWDEYPDFDYQYAIKVVKDYKKAMKDYKKSLKVVL